ncbi:MAG TPA: SGNH/GDSL hydrolase family protein [Actinomycetes bacterium]|jgi:lysophospholipase L1-like esterase|nr:SGNH/GDSL hydrolase family protein [Actinomycetes bacterium]
MRYLTLSVAAILLIVGVGLRGPADAKTEGQWVTAWGSSQQSLSTNTLTNATVRMLARSTVAGDRVRVKLEHFLGVDPVTFGEAWVSLLNIGASLVPGSNRQLTFGGQPSVTIPPGGAVISDPVDLRVEARQDLAVDLYVPGTGVQISRHNNARHTSYLTSNGAGNHAAEVSPDSFTETTTEMYWLTAVDVFSEPANGAIVAFGDSITDGSCSTTDGNDRWEDTLFLRLREAAKAHKPDEHKAMVNEGIGGNTVTRENLMPPPASPPGIERLDRDVLDLAGVTHVILFMGTNDIRREASAAQVIGGYQQIIDRVKARGLKIIGVTIIPRHNRPPSGTNTGWNDAKTAIRNEVNDWIRNQAPFDAVIDFDKVVRDPTNPNLINPVFNCDGIHPNPFGYSVMGESVDLKLFKDTGSRTRR